MTAERKVGRLTGRYRIMRYTPFLYIAERERSKPWICGTTIEQIAEWEPVGPFHRTKIGARLWVWKQMKPKKERRRVCVGLYGVRGNE